MLEEELDYLNAIRGPEDINKVNHDDSYNGLYVYKAFLTRKNVGGPAYERGTNIFLGKVFIAGTT